MNIKFDEPEIEEITRQIDVDDFETACRLEVGRAYIKIKCNIEKWERIKKEFLGWLWINIENHYPDVSWGKTREYDYDEFYKIDGNYMTIYQPFVVGDEL